MSIIYHCDVIILNLKRRVSSNPAVYKVAKAVLLSDHHHVRHAFFQELAWRFRESPLFPGGLIFVGDAVVPKLYPAGSYFTLITLNKQESRYLHINVLNIYSQICAAVGIMHTAGFSHCDIKSANILLAKRVSAS